MGWRDEEREIRGAWTAETTADDRLRGLVDLLNRMNGRCEIAEGRALAEEVFELCLSTPEDLSSGYVEDAYHCLCDVYSELGLEDEQAQVADRWRSRFGSEPPVPIFGLALSADGDLLDVFHSREEAEQALESTDPGRGRAG